MTDEDESWLDLHVNLSYNGATSTRPIRTDVCRFSSVTGLPISIPAGSQTTYDLDTTGIDLWNTSRFDTGSIAHELTYGGDWVSDDVETTQPRGRRRPLHAIGQAPCVRRLHPGQADLGVARDRRRSSLRQLQAERRRRRDVSGDRLSPRITVGVSPFESIGLDGLQIYGTYAEGYRSPSLSETLISGLHPNGVVFPFLPNPDLQAGDRQDLGIRHQLRHDGIFQADDRLRLKAAYYNNDIDDYIGGTTLSAFDPTAGCPFIPGPGSIPICFQYQNYANAKIQGFELESIYDAGWGFAGLSVSVIDGHTVSYEGVEEDLTTIPSSQVTGQLGFRFLEDKLTIGGEVQYNGAPAGNASPRTTRWSTPSRAIRRPRISASTSAPTTFSTWTTSTRSTPRQPTMIYEPGISLKLAATMRFGG